MKSTFTPIFILLLFTLFTGVTKADNLSTIKAATECSLVADENTSCDDNPCYPPNWTNTYNIYQTSCTWQWESCNGAAGYNLQWRYPGGSWYDVGGVCYQTWYNMNNLQPCTNYEWRVRSYCSYGYYSSWCYPYNFTTQCNNCTTPYGCYTDNISSYEATFHWNAVWGAESYSIQIQQPNGSWSYVSNNGCYNNWITAYGLQPNTYYAWRVRAHCGYNNYSEWTYNTYFTTYGSYCYYPSWLNCYDITEYGATWKWEPVSGADYYSVQWRYPGGSWYDLSSGPCYGTWVTVNHLKPCTTYEWRVRTHCYYGYSSWCNSNVFTTDCHSYCPTPTNLYTKDIGDTKATFKWGPVNGAYTYSVQIRNHYGTWVDLPGSPTAGIWITAYNLSPCTSYEWRVRSNCGYYESSSSWSYPQPFTTTCGHGCYAPEYVYTSGITSSTAALHWGPVIGADYFEVQYRKPGQDWILLQGGVGSNNVAELTGLDPETNYEWRVRAHCSSGNFSEWSSIGYFKTLGRSCGSPFFRYTHPITDSTATLNWSDVDGATSYAIQIRLMNGVWTDVPGSPTTDNSINVTGLIPNSTYEWRMQVNCLGSTYSTWLAPVMFVTGNSGGCSTPGNLSADNVTLTTALLSWSEVQGAESYSVEYRALPNGGWILIPGSWIDTNFVELDSLIPHTTYEWRVRANCTGGLHSFYSGIGQFTTTDQSPCTSPTNLSTDSVTETTATISWSPVAGAVGYKVEIRLPNGMWIELDSLITGTSFVIQGLKAHTEYEWRVRTKCGDTQFSPWSASVVFTTAGTAGIINDECSDATWLTVDSTCVATLATNVGSTPSSPMPMGGCASEGNNDVWFKFTMPDVANPAVTIRTDTGSLADAVMEVYSGTECGILSLITCEDNNDNGNGSLMPVINLTGTPNATIWVRVWGKADSTGTFAICVFDHISFDYTRPITETNADEGDVLIPGKIISSVTQNENPELSISPNPVNDRLHVQVNLPKDSHVISVRMMDLSGKVMLTQHSSDTLSLYQTEIEVSTLVPGMYLLQVQTTLGLMTEKVMVVR
ncbi:MAG: fibronectin type III domain-containing protein [Bacteroidota bacterium]|nr:fibronectin type III domain-containing protein [Bacteroidota bacterium]